MIVLALTTFVMCFWGILHAPAWSMTSPKRLVCILDELHPGGTIFFWGVPPKVLQSLQVVTPCILEELGDDPFT